MPKHDTSKSKKTLVKRIFQRRKDPRRTSPLVPIMVRHDGHVPLKPAGTSAYPKELPPPLLKATSPTLIGSAPSGVENARAKPNEASPRRVHSEPTAPAKSLPRTINFTRPKGKKDSETATPKETPSPAYGIAIAASEAASQSETMGDIEKMEASTIRTTAMEEKKAPSSAIANHSTKHERLLKTRAKTDFRVLDKSLPHSNRSFDAHHGPQASAVVGTGARPSKRTKPSTETNTNKSKDVPPPAEKTTTPKSKDLPTPYYTARTLTMDVEQSSGFTESPVQSLFIFGHGGFQRVVLVFACVAVFVSYSQSFLLVVESHPVRYWCETTNQRPASASARPSVESRHAAIPLFANDSYGECTQFNPAPINGTDNSTKVPCDHWQYDESESRSTIVAEWDLVCQRSRLKHLIWATFMTGGAVAVPTLGLTADVVGRRPVLIAAVLLLLLSGLGVCLCESLLWFTVLRFMSGASTGALDVISTVLLFESTPAGPRGAFVAASVSLATCLSPVFVATVSAVFATWRMLHVVLLVPALLLACLVFTIEESPHWCLYNNKFDDAERVALWAARLNLEDPDLVRDRLERIRKEAEFLGEEAVLRYPRLLRYIASAPVRSRCFALFGCWCFVYIAFYARDYWKLGPWIQTAQWFVVTVNFPAMAAAYALTRRHGGLHCAVPLLATCSMMSALQSALVAVGGQSSLLLVYCSSVIILNVTYVTLVVHTVDAFPTPARSLGYSGAFMFGRMGAMMGTLFREFESMPLPVNVLPTAVTSLGLVAFAASLLLVPPSTKGLFAADGSAFLRDKPGEVVLPVESPTLSWKVHKRMSPLQSPSCERE